MIRIDAVWLATVLMDMRAAAVRLKTLCIMEGLP